MCGMSKWGSPYACAIQLNPPWIFSLFSCGDVWGVFVLNLTCRVKNKIWRAQWCSFSSAVQGTSAGSLGFSGSAWWGWEEQEGNTREMKRIVRFCTSYSGMVCCTLGDCWRAGEFCIKCVIFSERQHLFNDFLLRFLMCLMWLSLWHGQGKHPFYNALCLYTTELFCLRWNYFFSGCPH